MFGISWDLSQVESCSWGSLMTKKGFKVVFPMADLDEVVFLVIFSPRPCVLVDGTGTSPTNCLGRNWPWRCKTPNTNKGSDISSSAPQHSCFGK